MGRAKSRAKLPILVLLHPVELVYIRVKFASEFGMITRIVVIDLCQALEACYQWTKLDRKRVVKMETDFFRKN